ncbi:carboxypeptidase-like regulatory domain-containing protein [Formosa undariae]|uniref:Carboxypeptidase-like regulatory domain-containing protein n=1 Tax=Formosa undariae TaxID=1325436 RepID=A0ABV5F6M5_9FLAO
MMKTHFILCLFIGSVSLLKAQNLQTIIGKIAGKDDIENIHVINKSSKRFTISNVNGEFSIEAKLNDTLIFSSIQYSTKEVVIDAAILIRNTLYVSLSEDINTLEEVVVGKVLTGNLMLDIGSSTAKRNINFYDVGIPGYQGKPSTKAERDLSGAGGEFKPIMLLGLLGGSLPVDPIINGISGRTKKLKKRIAFEKKHELMQDIRHRFSNDFFNEHPLSELKQMDFWYFCSDDPDFKERCNSKLDMEILTFLNEKYVQYNKNLKSE